MRVEILGGVMLISDGIYNQGISPTFSDYNFQIYTIGVGDTVPKSDISISTLQYNKISYQGNQFPLVVQIDQKNFDNREVNVSVERNGKLLKQERITLGRTGEPRDVEFLIDAENSGYQQYEVKVTELEGEFNSNNNIKQAYVEVIEGREQIALIASAPHPDIKAIKAAIETNVNYSIDEYILSNSKQVQALNASTKKYDLVIFHQLPDNKGLVNAFQENAIKSGSSILSIYGSNSNVSRFNSSNGVLSIDVIPNEFDQVTASFNQGFTSFQLSDELQQAFRTWPPITVPFGKIRPEQGTESLLYQQVGNIVTSKPLIAVQVSASSKRGLILGDGIWKWRMFDYANNENNELFNELVTKLVQYLSSKEDKRKFKVYPVKNEFLTNEKVIFDAEVYNELFERVYGNKIDLKLTNEEGQTFSYSYVTNPQNTKYSISGLKEGIYNYIGSTTIEGTRREVKGEFFVRELQLEDINLTADFNLLRKLSDKSQGRFYTMSNINSIRGDLSKKDMPGIIHSREKYLPFIQLKWLFFLLLGLLSAEWFIRKYSGSY
ncbi:hypothetical protein [Fulvivirga ligni]|uniref:hypothetical protein n=1 Tax=Fulvivirga ligni TaxID=2904246 RepID=UPI001F21750F|nr:hypothetical protein [Fulvivirga ligni]UII22868.1 hypothetical protein LVD16_06485 [Fulvivirga ligni]